jgi:hypothetical protein
MTATDTPDEIASTHPVVSLEEVVADLEARVEKLEASERKSTSRTKWIAPAVLGLVAVLVALCFTTFTPPANATAEQYLAQLVGLGAIFVAGAAVTKVLHRIWENGGWDIAEDAVKAVGLVYLAIVALVTYNFVGL